MRGVICWLKKIMHLPLATASGTYSGSTAGRGGRSPTIFKIIALCIERVHANNRDVGVELVVEYVEGSVSTIGPDGHCLQCSDEN